MSLNQQTRAMFAKAESKLKTARIDFNGGQYDDVVSRAYYAVYHAISALLFSKGLVFSSHSQTIGAFNKEFIKTGVFSKEVTRVIQNLFDDRQIGDYDFDISFDKQTAEEGINNAEKLLEQIKTHLESIGEQSSN